MALRRPEPGLTWKTKMPSSAFVRIVVVAILPCLAAAPVARAQETPATEMHATGYSGGVFRFAGDVGRDFSHQAGYPFRLLRSNPFRFIAGAGLFAGLVATDHATHETIASPQFVHEHGLEGATSWMSGMSGPARVIPLAAAVGVVSAFGPAHERETGLMLSEALITSGVWTGAVKFASGRERPRETSEFVSDWTGPAAVFADDPTGSHSMHSFPSGHASGAFAIATVLSHQYPAHGIVPLLAYGTAAAIGYARMAQQAHWLSDVVVGGFIGYGCARQVISAREERALQSDRSAANAWHLYVDAGGDMHALGLLFQF
jgi:membrane-associated phospholipid phosphatase